MPTASAASTRWCSKGGYEYDDFCATYYKYEKGLLASPTGTPGFSTPSGRIELVPYATFGAWGIPPLAEHVDRRFPPSAA